jgi:hypothetical protein
MNPKLTNQFYRGAYNDIAVDGQGKVHIVYQESTFQTLEYTTNETGSWQTAVVMEGDYSGEYVSMALDDVMDLIHVGCKAENAAYYLMFSAGWMEP